LLFVLFKIGRRKDSMGIFDFGTGKKTRVTVTKSEKNEIWDRQNGRCWKCGTDLTPTITEYHHKDGNPSNWSLSNIALVCSNCHKRETNKQRITEVHKRRKQNEGEAITPFGGAPLFGSEPKGSRRKQQPFGGSLFGSEPKKSRSAQPFSGSMFGFEPGRKRKKRTGIFG
jgi:hypothetical protein